MHRLNKDFDRIVCINLVNRPDKREKMQSRFNKLEISFEWYNAVQYGFLPNLTKPIIDSKKAHFNPTTPYEIGAALSHYAVIKQAFEEGIERLFVFEDDAVFHKEFNSRLDKSLDLLPADWNIILLYSFMYEILPENKRVNSRWITSYRAWSLMSYGINRKAMAEYIKRQDQFFTISDLVTFKMQEEGWKIYSAVPTLCVPSMDVSNIRTAQNYIQTPTIINLGINEKETYTI